MAKEFGREGNFKLGEYLLAFWLRYPYRDTEEARQVSVWRRWLLFFSFQTVSFYMWSIMLASKEFLGEPLSQHPVIDKRNDSDDLWNIMLSLHVEIF